MLVVVILMVLVATLMVVKETLRVNGHIIFYNKCISHTRAKGNVVGSMQAFIDKQEEQKRQLTTLQIYEVVQEEQNYAHEIQQKVVGYVYNRKEERQGTYCQCYTIISSKTTL